MTSLLRQDDVIWHNYVKMTSFWRYNHVIITSCVQWVCAYHMRHTVSHGTCGTPLYSVWYMIQYFSPYIFFNTDVQFVVCVVLLLGLFPFSVFWWDVTGNAGPFDTQIARCHRGCARMTIGYVAVYVIHMQCLIHSWHNAMQYNTKLQGTLPQGIVIYDLHSARRHE